MPTVTLTYQLPEEQTEYDLVVHAFDLKTVIRELDEELRRQVKYADDSDNLLSAGRQAARELLRMLITEYEVHNLIFEE